MLFGCGAIYRQRHLPGTGEIIEQIADFLVGKRREQTFGHHAEFALAHRGDFVARDGEQFVGGLKHDGFVAFNFDEAGEAAAVFGLNFAGAIFVGNNRIGIDNRFQQIGQISPIGAGNGIVVFGALDGLGNPGIYAVPQTGGRVTKIIARGDPIRGFTVADLGFRRAGFDGKNLAFLVSYAGFLGTGLYSTEVVLP